MPQDILKALHKEADALQGIHTQIRLQLRRLEVRSVAERAKAQDSKFRTAATRRDSTVAQGRVEEAVHRVELVYSAFLRTQVEEAVLKQMIRQERRKLHAKGRLQGPAPVREPASQ